MSAIIWSTAEAACERLVPLIGRLYREHRCIPTLFGHSMVHKSPIAINRAHNQVDLANGKLLDPADTERALNVLLELPIMPVELDLGAVLVKWHEANKPNLTDYLMAELAPVLGEVTPGRATDVVLYGFGRIGRILARLLVAHRGGDDKFRLRAIVVRKKAEDDLERRANLLRRDSIHGPFSGEVLTDPANNDLIVNGQRIHLLYADSPEFLDYAKHGIIEPIIIDNTGKWRDRVGLSRHLDNTGASKVILTAPGKGDIRNIVFGINTDKIPDGETIISAASCTTNAIVPVLKVLNDEYGIESGHIESIHSFTNDQNLIDNYHTKARRGRSAPMNLVITETGAGKAVAKAVPALAGKLTASAIRVPTPDVSLAIMNLRLEKTPTAGELNEFLLQMATISGLRHQIGWTSNQDCVSTDLVGDTHASVIDATATQAHDNHVVLYCWYDNEWGYSCQVMRLLEHVIGVVRTTFP